MNSKKFMDSLPSNLSELKPVLKKFSAYILLIIGLLFIAFGNFGSSSTATQAFSPSAENQTQLQSINRAFVEEMQIRLESVLREISGVGEVTVMLTLASSSKTVIASDERISENITQSSDGTTRTQNINRDVKVATLRDQPLILQELEPQIEGVVVVAEGANNQNIARSINQAVVALTGVKTHRVVVLAKK